MADNLSVRLFFNCKGDKMYQQYEQPVYTKAIAWDWVSFGIGIAAGFFIFSAIGREIIGTAGRYGEKKAREKISMFKETRGI